MASDSGGGLQDFVAGRYAELRRSAFLMCGDWALADRVTQKSMARLIAENRRAEVDDPDAFVYSHLMAAFHRRRPRNRHHLFTGSARRPDPEAARAASAHHRSGEAFLGEASQAGNTEDIRAEAGIETEAGPDGEIGAATRDPVRTIRVLDALHELAPRCRAVLILRHWDGFAVDETAEMLGLADERVAAYEAAGLAALDYLLAGKDPAR